MSTDDDTSSIKLTSAGYERLYANVRKAEVQIRPSPLEYPRSWSINWVPALPAISEIRALEKLKIEWTTKTERGPQHSDTKKEVLIVDLSEFSIYRTPGQRNEYQLTPLHHLEVKAGTLSLNGVLSLGSIRCYVEQMAIEDYSIEGYDDNDDDEKNSNVGDSDKTPNTVIFIQSRQATHDSSYDIWYRLTDPAPIFRRFHGPFQWIVDFGKHVIDYVTLKSESTVSLKHFQVAFHAWLFERYSGNPKFLKWIEVFGATDFRVAIHAYIDYLYNQAWNLPGSKKLLSHPFWAECLRSESFIIKQQPVICQRTVGTPLVYHCFKNMYFGECLNKVDLETNVRRQQGRRKKELGFSRDPQSHWESAQGYEPLGFPVPRSRGVFTVGDVIGINRDKKSDWQTHDPVWLAYVQQIEVKDNVQRLYLLWLYRPADTSISTMAYPYGNELFLSDDCNCSKDNAPVYANDPDISHTYLVDWRPKDLGTATDIFVRTKYLHQEDEFVTLKDSDFECQCLKRKKIDKQVMSSDVSGAFRRGDCVLISKSDSLVLEPVVISSFDNVNNRINVRRLLRLERDCLHLYGKKRRRKIAANELVWTGDHVAIPPGRIIRRCHVRYFTEETILSEALPVPYNRGGNGDCWVISLELVTKNGTLCLRPLSGSPRLFDEGFDTLSASCKPLRGLSIFSGGGNLDRGLEEGGAVRFTNAVDISGEAVHTQLANCRHAEDFQVYWGSVDDYLKAALQGKDDAAIARMGEIQFIAAGSPCPGFSSLQRDWKSENSLRNASHITSFCSFVDIFRPEYAILENVVTLTNKRKGHEHENVFAQLIACLVAMGYQVQHFLMDSWSHGSSQQRSRVFVSIAAPGLKPILRPPLTHSHPCTINNRSFGTLPNNVPFGCREWHSTPFEYVSAEASTSHLPDIGSGTVQACVPFPDHRLVSMVNSRHRALIRCIPISQPGQGYAEAVHLGLVPRALRIRRTELGKSYRRIRKSGQFPTITTGNKPHDSRCGNCLHWEQPRPLSIMEAREAQGVPHYEVIIGSLAEQYRIIGNGVDRNVALALGLAIRWTLETSNERPKQRKTTTPSQQDNTIIDLTSSDEDLLVATNRPRIEYRGKPFDDKPNFKPLSLRTKRIREEDNAIVRPGPTSSDSDSRKKTRHSGLQPDFVPTTWNKQPEKVFKRISQL